MRDPQSVLQPWVHTLSFMQQSVLLSAMRNADGVAKRHPSKALVRWYRRCVVLSAFDGRALTDPFEDGGGSYTGPLTRNGELLRGALWDCLPDDEKERIRAGVLRRTVDAFIDARDEMSLHYFAHAAHAFEIVGYKHPDQIIRAFWHGVYLRMVHALHVWPETAEQMDSRLGDTPEGWEARNDPSSTCSD